MNHFDINFWNRSNVMLGNSQSFKLTLFSKNYSVTFYLLTLVTILEYKYDINLQSTNLEIKI